MARQSRDETTVVWLSPQPGYGQGLASNPAARDKPSRNASRWMLARRTNKGSGQAHCRSHARLVAAGRSSRAHEEARSPSRSLRLSFLRTGLCCRLRGGLVQARASSCEQRCTAVLPYSVVSPLTSSIRIPTAYQGEARSGAKRCSNQLSSAGSRRYPSCIRRYEVHTYSTRHRAGKLSFDASSPSGVGDSSPSSGGEPRRCLRMLYG